MDLTDNMFWCDQRFQDKSGDDDCFISACVSLLLTALVSNSGRDLNSTSLHLPVLYEIDTGLPTDYLRKSLSSGEWKWHVKAHFGCEVTVALFYYSSVVHVLVAHHLGCVFLFSHTGQQLAHRPESTVTGSSPVSHRWTSLAVVQTSSDCVFVCRAPDSQ